MSIHLKITCHGIIAFVPSTNDDQLSAFLPEVPANVITNQRTFVRFQYDNYSNTNARAVDGLTFPDAHVLLHRERLSIVGRVAAADAALRIDRFDDPRSSMPTGRDRKSLLWMPDAGKLNPGHGELNAAYFDDAVNAVPRLLARVDFTQGRVGTGGVEKILVPFRSTVADGGRRPMAREMVIQLDIDDDHFVLRSDPFEGERDPARDLRFEGEGDVELFIGNEPQSHMYDETPPIDPIDVIDKVAAKEFVFYNSLAGNPSLTPLLPHYGSRPGRVTGCSVKTFTATDAVRTTSLSSLGREAPLSTLRAEPKPKWSVFAFIAVDNSLRNAGQADLAEMAKADASKVSLVAQIDVPDKRTERFVLEPRGLVLLDDSLQNVNSADPKELTGFLDRCKKTRPAEHTAVFLLSHGTGLLDFKHKGSSAPGSTKRPILDLDDLELFSRFSKIGFTERRRFTDLRMGGVIDDTARADLGNEELERGLREALKREGPFSIIGFDSCLMGLVEIAYQVRLCGRYYVASQEDLAPEGWPYTDVLNALTDEVSPRDAAMKIVDIYYQAKPREGATLSAVDLQGISQLARALDDLGGALLGTVAEDIDTLAKAREETRFFADYDYIDLYGYAEALQTHFKDRAAVAGAAKAVLDEIERAVLPTKAVDRRKARAGGLSVYIPNAPVEPEYHQLAMSKDAPRWHDFVVEYGNNF